MKVGILSASGGWHVRRLRASLEERGAQVVRVPVDRLVARVGDEPGLSAGSEELDRLDAVVVRLIPRGSLDQMIFRLDALHRLARTGVPVINPPGAIERTVDKYYTSTLLSEAGIPTPSTVVAERMSDAMDAFRAFGDVVLKPLFGANGRGMVRIGDEEVAHRVFRALERERAVYYVQETVRHGGRDVRAFVVGGRIVASAERRAEGWRTNVARGGRMLAFELPADWKALALRAAGAVGVDYGGVDLLPGSSDRVFVSEVNGIPGWKGLEGCTGIDVAGAVADRVLERARAAGAGTEGPGCPSEEDGGDDGPTTADRFRRRIRELEDRLEASSDEAERDALRRDIEHLEAGLRVIEGSG